ncbi:MAG: ATP-binding cassette domain-containing protein [Pseudomonadota bacterium]
MGAELSIRDLRTKVSDGDRTFQVRVDSLHLEGGMALGLTGFSGTGKTMLLETLGLLRSCEQGGEYTLSLNGQSLPLIHRDKSGILSPAKIRAKHFGIVPQSGGLLPFLTTAENIALSQNLCRRIDPDWQSSLIEYLGLTGLETLLPSALSIGQRQRVAIARALAHRPALVIADEPTAALDPKASEDVMELLFSAAAQNGSIVLVSSHDVELLDAFEVSRAQLRVENSSSPNFLESVLHVAGAKPS